MADNVVFPKIILKKKQIPQIIEFCLDESIEFSVKQQTFPETDWEIELRLKDLKTAMLVGMYMRENRLELEGIDPSRYKKSAGSSKKADEKIETVKPEPANKSEKVKPETEDLQSPMLM